MYTTTGGSGCMMADRETEQQGQQQRQTTSSIIDGGRQVPPPAWVFRYIGMYPAHQSSFTLPRCTAASSESENLEHERYLERQRIYGVLRAVFAADLGWSGNNEEAQLGGA